MTDKKIAVVTGSSSGIGLGTVKLLAEKGYAVFVTYFKDKDWGEKAVKEITEKGGEATLAQVDVMSEESVKKLFDLVNKKYGKLDVLVNDAAVDYATPIETGKFEDWAIITRTKIDGNFLCTKYALPLLKKSKQGNVIIIASSMGDRPDPTDPAYSVGTAGTICFMKAMALALAKYNIRTNAIGPGETRTNNKFWKDMGDTDEMWAGFAKSNPMGRVCTPKDVAQTVLTIIEDKTNFWNGNMIYVNGGGHLK
ncbi:MAG: SDR family oxidoreductase [Patescibacteria group bacterium]